MPKYITWDNVIDVFLNNKCFQTNPIINNQNDLKKSHNTVIDYKAEDFLEKL